VITHRNFAPAATPPGADVDALSSRVIETLTRLLAEGAPPDEADGPLHLHLDWLQYKNSFRDPVMVRRAIDRRELQLPLVEMAVDLRRADVARLDQQLREAVGALRAGPTAAEDPPVILDQFRPWRDSLIWPFNRLFWQRLAAWEAHARRGFEAALPSGGSDANHPEAVDEAVGEFWTLLRDLDAAGQLPPDVYAMEIGVGSGARARLWLDKFKAFDDGRGTGFYSRLKCLLGDYSPATLDTALEAVGPHAPVCSVIPMDATNPFKTLGFLRFKILSIHLTNVYDNLTFDEIARRDGQLYLVEVRPYISAAAARQITSEFGLAPAALPDAIAKLLEWGPEGLGETATGMAFWTCIWQAMRLEERLRALDEGEDEHLPKGVSRSPLDDVLAEAPPDIRFHLSRGAAESFVNTVPLLHPRGSLQVQDVFVTAMKDYTQGFRGPGKLDGSFVTWVNGPLLRAVGARTGYDVHFAPFKYRKGSKTQILYTTPKQ
jgi:hypothetical protein